MYRVIHKSLRDVRPLRYSSRDGHAEGQHVNWGRDTPSFCPTLQVLICSFLLCLSWLLCSRFRKFRRDLRITLCIACLAFYFLHSLLSITVTECNQQPDLLFSIDRSLPAEEQRTVLPTAHWVVPFLRKGMDFFSLFLEQGCTRFPKNIGANSKFYVPEGWLYEEISLMGAHKPPNKI
jgi:hypothetical protein